MAAAKTIVLITGGNAGIGFELASQLLQDPTKHVLIGSRSTEKGMKAVKELQSRELPGTVEVLEVDICHQDSIEAAANSVASKHNRLDVLVNNAGVAAASGSPANQMLENFQTNAMGSFLMVTAFTPLLEKSSGTPRIINVSSVQGSITIRQDPTVFGYEVVATQYRTSKTALNMITACQAYELGDKGFKVFAYCPGFTVSALSSHNKADFGAHPTSEGAAPMVKIINGDRDVEHSKFLHGAGQYAW